MILTATITAFLLIIIIVTLNLKRANGETKDYHLTPNCLMTQKPILFLSGKKSLFYFGNYWNNIPDYLAAHGYEVEELSLSWTNEQQRLKQTVDFLTNKARHKKSFHIVGDSSSAKALTALSNMSIKSIHSLWLTSEDIQNTPKSTNSFQEKPLSVKSLQPATHLIRQIHFKKQSNSPNNKDICGNNNPSSFKSTTHNKTLSKTINPFKKRERRVQKIIWSSLAHLHYLKVNTRISPHILNLSPFHSQLILPRLNQAPERTDRPEYPHQEQEATFSLTKAPATLPVAKNKIESPDAHEDSKPSLDLTENFFAHPLLNYLDWANSLAESEYKGHI